MAKKASGKKAWGFSDRSGRRYRLRDMRTEWTGVKVGPDEYEEKHPQLNARSHGGDAEALHDPRPPIEKEDIRLEILGYDTVNLRYREPITGRGEVGRVGIGGDAGPAQSVFVYLLNNNFLVMEQGTPEAAVNTYFPDGFEATMSLGVVSTDSTEVSITGVSATGHPANSNLPVAFSVPGNVTVTGFGITASQGTVTITPSVVHEPTGLSATVGQGTVTVTAEVNPTVTLTGVQAYTFDDNIVPFRDVSGDDTIPGAYNSGSTVTFWTGQEPTLVGNSASGWEVESMGKLYTANDGTDYSNDQQLNNGVPELALRIRNKTGTLKQVGYYSGIEIKWKFGKTIDGQIDSERIIGGLYFRFPLVDLSYSFGLHNYGIVGDTTAGLSGDQLGDGQGGDSGTTNRNNPQRFFENSRDIVAGEFTVFQDTDTSFTASRWGTAGYGATTPNSNTAWQPNADLYFNVRLDQYATANSEGMINAPLIIEQITFMFADPPSNWTSTTAAGDGFRITFNPHPQGGVGTPTIDTQDQIILTGLEAKATMNDPWNEDDDHGGDGFAEVDGSPSTNWRYTPSPVLRLGWHLDISTAQTWEVSANGSSAYNFYSPASGTTYSNPDLHLHKDNQYIFDMSDSSLQSHPFRIQQTGTSLTGITTTSYNNSSASTYRSTFGATNYSYQNEGNAGDKLYIYPLHADGRPNGVYGDADPSDATQDRPKARIGNRTLFYRCEIHAAMRGRFHLAPYCEWPVQGTPDAGTDVAGGDYLQYWTKPS